MAAKLNAGDDVTRSDYFFVDPFQVMINEKVRGRCKPPSDEKILEMAESMLEHGQQQPVQARKIKPENKIQINFGFTRTAAARLIRTGFTGTDGAHYHDPAFKLKLIVTDANDEVAFINNIIENNMRNATTPIDDAFNHKRLREEMGKTNAEITKLYGYKDPNKVARYQDLLGLSKSVQDQIDAGTMPVSAALALLELPESEREAAILAATSDTGKVKATEVISQVREHHLRDQDASHIGSNATPAANGTPAGKGGKTAAKPLTVREMKKFFEEYLAVEDSSPKAKEFCTTILQWMNGRRSTKTMEKALTTLAK